MELNLKDAFWLTKHSTDKWFQENSDKPAACRVQLEAGQLAAVKMPSKSEELLHARQQPLQRGSVRESLLLAGA